MACAAALATLDAIEAEGLVERARSLGDHALESLRELARRHPAIRDVRGLGLLLGVELKRDPAHPERAERDAERILYGALSRGLSFKISMGTILTLVPPLNIAKEDLDHAIEILDACFTELQRPSPKR